MVMVMIFTYDMRMIARAGSARASPSAKSISPAEALVTFNSILDCRFRQAGYGQSRLEGSIKHQSPHAVRPNINCISFDSWKPFKDYLKLTVKALESDIFNQRKSLILIKSIGSQRFQIEIYLWKSDHFCQYVKNDPCNNCALRCANIVQDSGVLSPHKNC